MGDVDGDCVPDWVVGANEAEMVFDEGYAWVVSGRTGGRIRELIQSDSDGVDACGCGDVDADGIPDVALSIESKQVSCSGWNAPPSNPERIQKVRMVSGGTWKTIWEIEASELRKRGG